VVGRVADLGDLREALQDGHAHSLSQRDLCHAASLAATTHMDERDSVADVEEVDMAAVRCHRWIDLVVEESLHIARQLVEPEGIRILDLERAAEAVGVDGDPVEVRCRLQGHREPDSCGPIDHELAITLLTRRHEREVVAELTIAPPRDSDAHAGVRLLAIGSHLLDAGQGVVSRSDSGGLHVTPMVRLRVSQRRLDRMPMRLMLVLPTETYRATAFLRAAGILGLEVVVASNEAPTLATLMEGRVLTLDLQHPAESADRAAAFASKWPVHAVVGVDEASVVTAAHIAERLGTARRNPVAAVEATRDKRLLRQRLTAAGVPQPRFVALDVDAGVSALDDAIRVVGLPCVVKPVDLAASRGVIRADSRAEVVAAVHRVGEMLRTICVDGSTPPLLIEAYVDGFEVAVEGLVRDGTLDVIALFDKPDPLIGPFFEETLYVAPSRLDGTSQRAVVDAVHAAVAALGLRNGPIHAEVRLSGDQPVVIEVAARSIGGLCSQVVRLVCDDAPDAERSLEEVILRHACRLPLGALRLVDGACGVCMLPIRTEGVLGRVNGVERAAAVAGITGVTISVPDGERVTPLPEGDRYLGFAFARGDSAADVETSLRRAQSLLDMEIESGSRMMS
jgi:formate-dependent phosphoribosylglycinamide formyltransferase (GAR transformylase)